MTRVKVPWESWVVVCDGAKALFMQNAGDAELINLQVHETLQQDSKYDHEIGTDRPGRTHQSHGAGRSAVEEVSFHDQAEDDFLKQVAEKIDELVQSKNASPMVLVAAPRALGTLRSHLSQDAKTAISAEIAKDLTNIPVDQIERHLLAA